MKYQVFYTDRVAAEVGDRIDGLRSEHVSQHIIEAWFSDLFDAIDNL